MIVLDGDDGNILKWNNLIKLRICKGILKEMIYSERLNERCTEWSTFFFCNVKFDIFEERLDKGE